MIKSVVYVWGYTLYCVCVITSRHTAAAEEDTVGEQQLKRTQSGSSSWSGCNQGAAAEADATCWSGCSSGAVRSDYARLVLARDTTAQGASE